MPSRLLLPPKLTLQLWAHAWAAAPHECVGVLGGRKITDSDTTPAWNAQLYLPLPNVAEYPQITYQAEAQALIKALRTFRETGLELVAIFHSHPRGPAVPSPTDMAQAGYDLPYLIADLSSETLRAFLLPSGEGVEWLEVRE